MASAAVFAFAGASQIKTGGDHLLGLKGKIGIFVTQWAGVIVQSSMFLSFDPVPNSVWSFLIVAAVAYTLSVAVSLRAGRAVCTMGTAAVLKRNLS